MAAGTLKIPFLFSVLFPPDKMNLEHGPSHICNAQMHKSIRPEKNLKLQLLVKLSRGNIIKEGFKNC